jgi:hypothetical protein
MIFSTEFASGELTGLSLAFIQVNYHDDHVKIILCPLAKAVTVMSGHPDETVFHTYSFEGIAKYGCSVSLYNHLKDARRFTYHLIATERNKRGCPDVACAGAEKDFAGK